MRIGLTGGIASGKSTVASMLRDLGATIIDADAIARDVVAKETPGLAQVVEAFGPEILTDDGELDRPKLAAIVFGDEEQRRLLESITHPLIGAAARELDEVARADGRLVINDVPLLVEVGTAQSFDEVIVVDVDPEEQVRRMIRDRHWTEDDARARMATQATREERRAVATYLIDNSGSLGDLRAQVEKIYAELLEKAG